MTFNKSYIVAIMIIVSPCFCQDHEGTLRWDIALSPGGWNALVVEFKITDYRQVAVDTLSRQAPNRFRVYGKGVVYSSGTASSHSIDELSEMLHKSDLKNEKNVKSIEVHLDPGVPVGFGLLLIGHNARGLYIVDIKREGVSIQDDLRLKAKEIGRESLRKAGERFSDESDYDRMKQYATVLERFNILQAAMLEQ